MKFRELYQKRTPTSVPALPDNVDDNFYLASASKAAEIDKLSGAYDEFLFSEDGLTEMPYERAIDDHLALVEMRLLDRGRRAVLLEKHKLIDAEAEVSKLLRKEDSIKSEIEDRNRKLEEQAEILAGNKAGKSSLYWPGTAPTQTSLLNSWMRLSAPYLVFFLVGVVDIFIIEQSFNQIIADTLHAWLLTLPAIGLQLVFPHFIGNRIAMLLHKPQKKTAYILEAIVMFGIWVTFAVVLTDLRIQAFAGNNTGNQQIQEAKPALFLTLLLMLIGLGLWLMINEIRHNPHETKYARLAFSKLRLEQKKERLSIKIAKTTGLLPAIEASLEVAEKSYEDSIQAARSELADAAKSVYRRSLINQLGTVDFTSAYLAKTKSPSQGREKRRIDSDNKSADKAWRKTPRQKIEESKAATAETKDLSFVPSTSTDES